MTTGLNKTKTCIRSTIKWMFLVYPRKKINNKTTCHEAGIVYCRAQV